VTRSRVVDLGPAIQHPSPSSAMLDSLPNELLSSIFALACTDGGKSASVLRRVSRRIQLTAEVYRFRAAAVAGAVEIAALVNALENCSPEQRIIQHLFVSDKAPSRPHISPADGSQLPPSNADYVAQAHLSPLIHALVQYGAPHLLTLTIITSCGDKLGGALAGTYLPQLHTLTLHEQLRVSLEAHLHLPRVCVLNISLRSYDSNQLESLVRKCPALEQVRVYGAEISAEVCRRLIMDNTLRISPVSYEIFSSGRPDYHSVLLAHVGRMRSFRIHNSLLDWSSYATWRTMWAETVEFWFNR
jgi:hypothetical protein